MSTFHVEFLTVSIECNRIIAILLSKQLKSNQILPRICRSIASIRFYSFNYVRLYSITTFDCIWLIPLYSILVIDIFKVNQQPWTPPCIVQCCPVGVQWIKPNLFLQLNSFKNKGGFCDISNQSHTLKNIFKKKLGTSLK